ncbi:hypothetical protein NEPAR06_0513 [Nematocida parisii]|uniref:Uncharacterized protein n=1 Tax=Nematocida parisii (strain ERTm3) TaxID=935791 RepID=I3EJD9_NEMP3|nr:hypothetical protein NEQG_00106 [Nematocida parisii ERTm3]KAI5127459.1 hypothetical protein NEPAR08_0900 [Nematocida parisii]KAI5129024.1 hypothetical protein NEPAR03_1470 [Nematocida parisii]KAI5141298.1 hypothetical protein NEPAR04_0860 [Nematocida parisii]KAI5142569.1 hypothetical protein NEPAR07_0174 [Nematocida parisii]
MAISLNDLAIRDTERIKNDTEYNTHSTISNRHTTHSTINNRISTHSTISNKLNNNSVISNILEIPLENELERELASVRYNTTDINRLKEERRRRVELSQEIKANTWSKRIKSKSYRKKKREEKQKRHAETIKIEEIVDSTYDTMCNNKETEEKTEENIKIKKIEETAYNHIKELNNTGYNTHSTISNNNNTISNKSTSNNSTGYNTHSTISNNNNTISNKSTSNNSTVCNKLYDTTPIESILDISFHEEREAEHKNTLPKSEQTTLLGWNTWSSDNISNKSNTVYKYTTGIEIRQRKDFSSSHVIYKYNNNSNKAYSVRKVPYGYKPEEYTEILNRPELITHNPINILNKIIKNEKEKRNRI